MNAELRIAVLRSALLALLPEHALSKGRCDCGDNCPHERALSALDLTRPESSFMVPAMASRVANGNGPCSPEQMPPSHDAHAACQMPPAPEYGSEGA